MVAGLTGCNASGSEAASQQPTPASSAASSEASGSSTALPLAPWVDVTAPPVPDVTPLVRHGITTVNAGFVTAVPGRCSPSWGGVTAIDGEPATLIRGFRAAGGDVRVSFGGADGVELAAACPTPAALASAYEQVIDALDVRLVDLDIEGGVLSDAASVHRRNEALARVVADADERGRPLRISYTLPVEPAGLTPAAINLLQDAHSAGIPLDAVDVLAMNFGGNPPDVVSATADAVRNAKTTLEDVWGKSRPAVAVTAMIGVNDMPGQILPLADANRLAGEVRRDGAAWMGFWSLNRDRPCEGAAPLAQPTCSGVSQPVGAFTQAFRAGAG